jgi:hypothetical protein
LRFGFDRDDAAAERFHLPGRERGGVDRG